MKKFSDFAAETNAMTGDKIKIEEVNKHYTFS